MTADTDCLIVGGGFYGCALALFLRSAGSRVTLVEAEPVLLERASRVNQARVHTGFHYPRSPLTAVKSMVLHQRFARDFPDAVVDDFQMLYAISRNRSKISAKRFHVMYRDMGAPILPAPPALAALFDPAMVEAAFLCTEFAFDYAKLRARMAERLEQAGVELRLGTEVASIAHGSDAITVGLADGSELRTQRLFNVTYGQINHILRLAGLPEAALKYELAEVALVEPPEELRGYGVTVMDGPFFSLMPYPAEKLHSLTHVRYTPHASWSDAPGGPSAYETAARLPTETRIQHMIADARRYLPPIAGATWRRSLFEVKTVLAKNERDDGRPILYQRSASDPRVVSIMGGKIDNIYDLFDLVRATEPQWAGADAHAALERA